MVMDVIQTSVCYVLAFKTEMKGLEKKTVKVVRECLICLFSQWCESVIDMAQVKSNCIHGSSCAITDLIYHLL